MALMGTGMINMAQSVQRKEEKELVKTSPKIIKNRRQVNSLALKKGGS